ncbi:MAG: 2-oxoacid:acceptor oxidoreductase family protein [Oscillospiraceae bacterium]|nr:2-oxoacid:acceptor oxidoreductase family protein [Oscillospiraceae bacterium]
MEKSVLMGGFGGQGVQTCGQLLIYSANEEDKICTFYSQYGGAMRGGTSNCTVITSDEEIGAPNKKIVDYVVAFNIPSFKKFEERVAPGGTMVVNSSIIPESLYSRSDITYAEVAANDISQEIGSSKVLNVVMLGFFCEYSGMVDSDVAREVVLKKMAKKPEFIEMNKKAFEEGRRAAKAAKTA